MEMNKERSDTTYGIEDIMDKTALTRLEEEIMRTGKTTYIGGYDFKCTCFACPEQYDVYLNGESIAYVRERHGHLTVNPIINGTIDRERLIYEEYANGRSDIFEKREEKLTQIAKEIERFYLKSNE